MNKGLKWTIIGCGGLLGLLVVVVVLMFLYAWPVSETTVVSVVTVAESGPMGSESDLSKVPDGTERTNPVPLGYSVTHNNLKITILEFFYIADDGGLFAILEENHRWSRVNMQIEAVGGPNQTYRYNTKDFRLVGDRGVIYDDWVLAPDGDMGSGELFGGGKLQTGIIRQVHKDDTNMVLIYSPGFAGSRYLALESGP